MLKIKLITVGHLKEDYLRKASDEYAKRLSAFCKLEIVELDAQRLSDNPGSAEINLALEKESAKISQQIPQGSYVVSLCIEGKEFTSEELSSKLSSVSVAGTSSICFIIGSSYGMSKTIKDSSDLKLSMSQMTFPHQLARIMLLEQIYRAFKIQQGSTYHK